MLKGLCRRFLFISLLLFATWSLFDGLDTASRTPLRATVRTRSPQRSTPNAAVVYLIRDRGMIRLNRGACPTFALSLGNLFKHFLAHNPSYKIIFLYESESWHPENMREVKNMLEDNMATYRVSIDYEFVEVNITDPHYNEVTHPRTSTTAEQVRFFSGYTNMCWFWFYKVFQLKQIQALDYYMRLDMDSCMYGEPGDIFSRMKKENLSYVWHRMSRDPAYFLTGMRQVIVDYFNHRTDPPGNYTTDVFLHKKSNTDKAPVPMFAKRLKRYMEDDGIIFLFGNNIEVVKVARFLSPEIQAFGKTVLDSQGIHVHRWGDAPLRLVTATLFLNDSEVYRHCFNYSHSSEPHYNPNFCRPQYGMGAVRYVDANLKYAQAR